MRKIGMICTGLLMLGCLAAGQAYGADKKEAAADTTDIAKKQEALGVARAQTQVAMQELFKAIDNNASGWNAIWPDMQTAYNKANSQLQTAINKENAKPAETRNAEYLENLSKEGAVLNELWQKTTQKDNIAVSSKNQNIVSLANGLSSIFSQNFANVDGNWTGLGLPPECLKSVFEAITARAGALKAEYKDVLGDYQQLLAVLQAEQKRIEDMAASGK